MDNQELLENLAQLQRSLQDIESARQMVDNTIRAYSGISSRIESYSDQLSTVSERITQLVEQISQNRDTLSADIDSRMKTALDKAESVSDSFSQQTTDTLTSFREGTTAQIQELNTAVNSLVSESQRIISEATDAAKHTQAESLNALDNASSKFEYVAVGLVKRIEDQYVSFRKETEKKMLLYSVIIIALIIITIVTTLIK